MQQPELVERFTGCLVGGAVGDALGASVEFTALSDILARYGPAGICDYDQVYGRRGAITDDTQMTLFTAEAMCRICAARQRGRIMDPTAAVYRSYLRWLHTQAVRSASADYDDALDGWLIRVPGLHSQRAPSTTCMSALRLPHASSAQQPSNNSKGCGGVVRVAPIGLYSDRPFELAARACALTHGHPAGYLAGGAFAQIIAHLVRGTPLAEAVATVRENDGEALGVDVRGAIDAALTAVAMAPPAPETVESLGEGWVAEEALAIAIYCALTARDFADGVRRAVNHSGDSDSTGSMTGNLLGTALGYGAIPSEWLAALELRDEIATVATDLAGACIGLPVDTSRYPPH